MSPASRATASMETPSGAGGGFASSTPAAFCLKKKISSRRRSFARPGLRSMFLAVNKADTEKQAHIVDEFHRLGIKQMFPVSAEHGRGIDDLLDAVLEVLPRTAEDL